MPSILVVLLLLAFPIYAQIGYDSDSNTLLCSNPGGHYCVSGSLQGSTIISCESAATAVIRSCNIELSEILPKGYEKTAICYESNPRAGNAICAFNGTGYLFGGSKVHIPETILCEPADVPETAQSKTSHVNVACEGTSVADTLPLPPTATLTTADFAVPAPSFPSSLNGDGGSICSNPWSKDTTTEQDDHPTPGQSTLRSVLVIPTPRYSHLSGMPSSIDELGSSRPVTVSSQVTSTTPNHSTLTMTEADLVTVSYSVTGHGGDLPVETASINLAGTVELRRITWSAMLIWLGIFGL